MPTWYLILSAVLAIGVLLGVAFAEFGSHGSHGTAFAGGGDLDTTAADAPTRREADTAFEWDERPDRQRTTVR